MKTTLLAALLCLSACATPPVQESVAPGYEIYARAHAVAPDQVLVEASIAERDGDVVLLPRVIMLADNEASIFVGESLDEGMCPDGIHGQFQTRGDQVMVNVQIIESGVERWSEEQWVPIESADQGAVHVPAGFEWPGFCGHE